MKVRLVDHIDVAVAASDDCRSIDVVILRSTCLYMYVRLAVTLESLHCPL